MQNQHDPSRRSFVTRGLAAGGALLASGASAAPSQERSPGPDARSAAERFRALLEGPEVLRCPVIFDAVSAKISEQLGFPAVFAGGQTVSANMYGIGISAR